MSEKKKYRVRVGHTHGMHGQYRPGDIVELTDHEVTPILHKFEAVAGGPEVKGSDINPNPDSMERIFGDSIAAKLRAAGLASVVDVRATSDADLRSIDGIDRAALEQIKNALGSGTLGDAGDELEKLLGADLAGKLQAHGFESAADVRSASDKELEEIPGVGKASVRTIREKVK